MTAWKDLERRICVALGGRRAGPQGASISDCVNTPFAVEVKRSSRPGPPVLAAWIVQARTNSRRENRPWLLVVAGHNDRRPVAALDFWEFVQIAQQAGRIPTPFTVEEGEEESEQRANHAATQAFDAAEAQPTLGLHKTPAKPASLHPDRVPTVSVPAGLQRSTAGTATLKGANLETDTEPQIEPVAEPEPEPDTPDEPDTDDEDEAE